MDFQKQPIPVEVRKPILASLTQKHSGPINPSASQSPSMQQSKMEDNSIVELLMALKSRQIMRVVPNPDSLQSFIPPSQSSNPI
ncbi:hypothetical protein FGO68_gene4142 [Halteria grandinella]|uniref:Uncharacterized protein n=1 Tax=Halteria grandinella TaxID=5974 RepID=A0A8J8ND76_HALGN|nr:hypothetical protein FGO68_gene4142 [Halteria grandinella]